MLWAFLGLCIAAQRIAEGRAASRCGPAPVWQALMLARNAYAPANANAAADADPIVCLTYRPLLIHQEHAAPQAVLEPAAPQLAATLRLTLLLPAGPMIRQAARATSLSTTRYNRGRPAPTLSAACVYPANLMLGQQHAKPIQLKLCSAIPTAHRDSSLLFSCAVMPDLNTACATLCWAK